LFKKVQKVYCSL